MKLALYLFAVFTSLSVASGQQFAACTDPAAISGGLVPTLLNVVFTLLTSATLPACESSCKANGNSYAYFEGGILLNSCVCSNTPPPSQTYDGVNLYQQGTSSQGTCASTNVYTAVNLVQPQIFQGCYTPSVSGSAGLAATQVGFSGAVASLDACYSACSIYPTMITIPMTSGQWQCYCSNSYTGQTSSNAADCNENVAQLYTQSVPTISGLTRRKRELRLTENVVHELTRKEIDAMFCPHGMSACNVEGDIGAFECIDTKTELESCGGCMTTPFNSTSLEDITLGTDCTSLPGISLGGVTCEGGSCIASACKPGWTLKNNRCIPSHGALVNQQRSPYSRRNPSSSSPLLPPGKRSSWSGKSTYPPSRVPRN